MHELILRLEGEDKSWRKKTVLYWDGAGYHSSKEIKAFLSEQQVPMLQLAPYGYLIAAAELLFGALKSKYLNAEEALVGKK